jgi:NRAMP (natural resistance-associated macrophage protein)-like metal ion transporter
MSSTRSADSDRPAGATQVAPVSKRRFWQLLGPGLITGASDDDPSGIATYSQVGAQHGYAMGWTLLFTYPLMSAIQEISGRIGRVTGKGIAGNIRSCYPASVLRIIIVLLLAANVINIGADLSAMGDAARLLIGGSADVYAAVFAIVCAALQIFSRYDRYVSILKWTAVSLLAYVATVIAVDLPWGAVAKGVLLPKITWHEDYLTGIVAVLGTTISPYLFFWQSSEEAEDERIDPHAKPLRKAPDQAPVELQRIRYDTYIGMGYSNLIAFFIMVTAAATLNTHGITDIRTSADAAAALRPIAGPLASVVFAIGIVGTGLLAIPVLAGSAAYAVGEALRWPTGLSRKPRKAKAFYLTIAVATLLGIGVTFTNIDPIKALFWSAVINGIVAVPVMVIMMVMASQRRIMGQFILPRGLAAMGWLASAVMAVAVGALFWTWIF